ncbi:extracellular solute-binding protein [Nonomuraea sp. NPDC050310]|uniref:ABC transporter substrate-binding protein n=1 Tax=Nonomuraea sp. NPDC050310 TaxID=3154935 RepID=UPI0033DEDFE6
MPRRTAALVALSLLLTGCGADGRVTLDFFQFKPEATEVFDRIIAGFEREHPGIRVVQNHVPNAETAVRARLVRGDVPDVLALNGSSVFGELARAGVFHDFSRHPAREAINPAVQRILDDLGTHRPGEVNGLPFASNANGIIYNKSLFDAHGVRPPTSWPDLLTAARRFEAAGVTPFYLTLKDAWTALPTFNALAANLAPGDFFARRAAGRTSFGAAYGEVTARLAELYRYGQPDRFSRGYDEGNREFAQGRSAMYLQGSYAIPAIRKAGPRFEIGTFNPHDKLVAGVDVAITMPREPRRPKEAALFVDYLMRPAVLRAYAREQVAVPPLREATPDDPALQGVMPFFAEGRLTGYPDHQIPLAVGLERIIQQFLIDGDRRAFLAELDSEYDKVMERRS